MPTAAQYGMATPAGTDLIRMGDNVITQNANATAEVLTRLEAGKFVPQPIPSGTDLLTLDTGWWYNRLTSVAGTMLNRPQGVTDGPFMVLVVRTPFGHSTITYYGYSGTAGGLFENHTGNAAHTAWVGWRRLDGTTGGGITQGSGLAGFANILRTQMFRDAMGPVTTGGRGAIAFRFDHGLSKFNSIIRPLLEARGIKYSLALSARNFNAGENAGVTASMVNSWAGAEVWNHGANQHQDESSVAGLTDQIVTGLAELQAALPNKQIWGYAVPGTGGSGQGGFFGGATAEQFYETAAGDLILTNHAVSSGSMSGTSRRPLDGRIRQGMAHFTIEAQTVARIKSEIDNAISNKTGNQLMMHPNLLNTEGYLTTAQLVEVLDYVVAKRDAGDLVVLSPYEMLVAQLSTSGGSGVPGPPGAGVPEGGEALQVIRKNAFNTTTEWATLTKSLVGLSNVDNTSDMSKPVSFMQKLALDEKLDAANLPDEVDGVNKNLIEDPASLTSLGLLRAIRPATGHDAVPLKRFRDALTQRKTRPVTIAHIGDSITVGIGGGLAGRFASVLRDQLRAAYPTNGVSVGGRGFLSLSPSNYSVATLTGITALQGGSFGFSPDINTVRLDATGRTITYPIVGTGADILYTEVDTGGSFYWKVDGGNPTVVNTKFAYSGTTSVAQIRGLSAGAHTIEIGHSVDGVNIIAGLIEYNGDETSGFRSIVGGVGGTTAAYWAGNTLFHMDYMPAYEPDLVVIGLGTNDYYHPTAHISAAAYKTHLLTIIQGVKDHTTVDPSIVLLLPAPVNATTPLDPWIDYKTVAYAIAAADPAVSVFDWGYPMNPTAVATLSGGLIGSDLVHPSLAGHKFIGEALARFVGVV